MIEVRDETLKRFADSYFEPFDEELLEMRTFQEQEGVPLIMRETESVLRLLLTQIKPSRILELGTAHGYSALFFAKLLPGAQVTTIDRNPYMIDYARSNFESHPEGKRIDFRIGEATEVLRELKSEMQSDDSSAKFDFVFIDAGKSHYRDFLHIIESLITDNAYIVCDNILMKGWIVEAEGKDARRHRTNIKYMKQFLDYIHERSDLEVCLLSGADGMAIIRYRQ